MKTQVFGLARIAFFMMVTTCNCFMATAQSASADIGDVWIEHNVFYSGVVYQTVWNGWTWTFVPQTVSAKGMKIHVDFNVYECQGEQVRVCAFFYDDCYNPIKGISAPFKAPDGHLTSQSPITPLYESTTYTDGWLFVPYSEFNRCNGSFIDCYAKVEIQKQGNALDQSDWLPFSIYK